MERYDCSGRLTVNLEKFNDGFWVKVTLKHDRPHPEYIYKGRTDLDDDARSQFRVLDLGSNSHKRAREASNDEEDVKMTKRVSALTHSSLLLCTPSNLLPSDPFL